MSHSKLFLSFILLASFFGNSFAAVRYDFDGDGKTDPTVMYPVYQLVWYSLLSSGGISIVPWGYDVQGDDHSDWFFAADYDGDGKTDIAIWREPNPIPTPQFGDQAYFYILYSSTGTYAIIPWGRSRNNSFTDFPVRGDFDGDGTEDVAIGRQINSGTGGNYFYILQSRDGLRIERFGNTGDSSAVGDYDGDGKADLAVARPQCPVSGCQYDFYIKRSSDGNWMVQKFGFTASDYILRNVDFDGDGKSDIAVWSGQFQTGSGYWSWIRSSDGAVESVRWGFNSAVDGAAPGDYDGDGKTDPAVYRRNTFGDCNVPSYFWLNGQHDGRKSDPIRIVPPASVL